MSVLMMTSKAREEHVTEAQAAVRAHVLTS
jgi:hypothetical protein